MFKSVKRAFNHKHFIVYTFAIILSALTLISVLFFNMRNVSALDTSKLKLSAEVDTANVLDGTPGFDADNNPGNDSSAQNGIVRSNDVVTTPLKIVANTTDGSLMKNIKLKIEAMIEDNKIGTTTKATFSDKLKTRIDADTKSAYYTEYYTLSQTGQAISFPILAIANGVDNGTTFKIKYRVTVLDENDKPTSIIKNFEYNRDFTISSRVNIGVAMYSQGSMSGVRSEGLITSDFPGKDVANQTVSMIVGIYAKPLEGRVDLKGSALPTGPINYTMTKSGEVKYDNGQSKTLDLNGNDANSKIVIGDAGGYYENKDASHTDQRALGKAVVDGSQGFYVKAGVTDYGFNGNSPNWTWDPNSIYLPYSGPDVRTGANFVRDSQVGNILGSSGHWSVDYDHMTNTSFTGVISDYYNYGYPTMAASAVLDGNTRRLQNEHKNFMSVGSFLFRNVNEYAHGRRLNTEKLDNTMDTSYTMSLTGYTDSKGNHYDINASYTKTISTRNIGPGRYIVSGHFHNNKTNYAYSHRYHDDNAWRNFGDGLATNDSTTTFVYYGLRTWSESPFMDGGRWVLKWNPAFVDISADAEANKRWRGEQSLAAGYSISKNNTTKFKEQPGYIYQFGVLKDQSKVRDFEYVRNAKYDEHYNWYDSYAEAQSHGIVSATMIAYDAKLVASNIMSSPIMRIHDDLLYTNKQPDGSYNFATWDIYGYNGKFGDKASEVHIDKDYAVNNFAEWDPVAKKVITPQSPQTEKVDFDSLAVSGAQYSAVYFMWSPDENDHPKDRADLSVIKSTEKAYFGSSPNLATLQPGMSDSTLYEHFQIPKTVTFTNAWLYNPNDRSYKDIKPEKIVEVGDNYQLSFKLPTLNSTDIKSVGIPAVYIGFKANDKVMQYNSSGMATVSIIGNLSSDLDPMAKNWLNLPVEDRQGKSVEVMRGSSINFQKVSRVGVNQSISSIKSERDSQFRIITEPYTTQSSDENGVKGLIRLAQNGSNGSSFSGSYKVNVGYQAAGKTINFWYTNENLASFDPYNVDKTKFTPVTANSPALFTAKYIYYEIVEPIRNTDDIKIYTNVFPTGNKANDVYSFQSSLNSNTHYETPVLSEINTHSVVEHTISGTLWLDTNEDHLLDSGDDRLANERVTLTNTVTGESISTTTNANGEYSFAHVLGSKQVANNAWFDSSTLTDTNYVYKITHTKRANWLLAQKNKGLPAVSSKADLVNGISTIDGLDLADYSTFTGIDAVTQQNIGYLLMTKNMDISKNWSMNGATATSHSPITVTIKQNGTNFKTVTLSASNNWTISDKLPSTDANGNAYTYSAVETNTPNGYASSVNVSENEIDVTNTWKNEQTTVTINKNWVGFEKNKTKPSAKFHVLADGKVVKDVTLTAGSNWSATGSYQLPKYGTDGHTIDYTIEEYDVPPIVVDVAASEPSTNTFHVTNTRLSLQTLPNTGSGKIILLIGAVTIVFGAAITITIKQKRK